MKDSRDIWIAHCVSSSKGLEAITNGKFDDPIHIQNSEWEIDIKPLNRRCKQVRSVECGVSEAEEGSGRGKKRKEERKERHHREGRE